MKTIFEPAKPYFKLLGEQKVQAGANYRLMTFVVQAAVDDGLLLLHNMTKEMVLLSQEEQAVFEQRPTNLPELISQGVPVQLEPLGTFYPSAKVDKPVQNIAAMEGSDPNEVVKGVHIRFLPYGVDNENLTSRRFKEDYCTLEYRYVVARRELGTDAETGKKQYVQDKTPISTVIADWKKSQENPGD